MAARKNPSTWPERHPPVPSRDQEPALTVLADDTPCNFEISPLQLAQSAITGRRMAHSHLVVALKMWYASLVPLRRCVGEASHLYLNESRIFTEEDRDGDRIYTLDSGVHFFTRSGACRANLINQAPACFCN